MKCRDDCGYEYEATHVCTAEEAAQEMGRFLHEHAEFYEGATAVEVEVDGVWQRFTVEIDFFPSFTATPAPTEGE